MLSFNVFIATGAVRLAITAFIVPFAFVYGDGLLMVGGLADHPDILRYRSYWGDNA